MPQEDAPAPDSASDPAKAQPSTVTLHYIKSSQFRVVHCDGALGGPSPNGTGIHMSVFSERIPIPLQTINEFDGQKLSNETVSRVSREGIVREVEFDAVMPIGVAKSIGEWLLAQVDVLTKAIEAGKR